MKVKIRRDGSNWSGRRFAAEGITEMADAMRWMSAHGYIAKKAYNGNLTGNRHVVYKKAGCYTTYDVEFVK